jgi:hypothetical protein
LATGELALFCCLLDVDLSPYTRRSAPVAALQGAKQAGEVLVKQEVAPARMHVNADVRVPVQHLGELENPAE